MLVCAAVPVFAGREFTAGAAERTVDDELLIKLKRGANPTVLSAIVPAAVIRLLHQELDLYQLRLPAGLLKMIAAQLAAHNLVDYVEPNRIRQLTISAPNDTAYPTEQYALNTINALQAWGILPNKYLTSSSANTTRLKIALIDTGADCTHPDFMNVGGSSTNSALGGQFLWSSSMAIVPTTISNPPCAWLDDHGHGTHVAGILAAATNNSQGVASLGYPFQVIVYRAVGSDGLGIDSNIASAITSATDAGASVISLSFGASGYSQTIQTALNYAWQRNVAVVAAAGNNSANVPFFPAGGAHVLGVAATDSTNQRASFSNFGPIIGIAAPGDLIYSTAPTYTGTTLGFQNYTRLSGTSMATPHVSALAGLLSLSTSGIAADAVIQRVQQSANSSIVNGGWDQNLGYGIINAGAALSGTLRPATVGGIRGQAVDVNGIAVAGVVVSVGAANVTTDQSGFFRFFNLTAGTYSVSATGGGSPTQTLSVGVAPGADTPLTIQRGVQLATITGRVLNGASGVGGAVVQALAGGLLQASAVAAPDGNYSLAVPAGTYDVKASGVSRIATVVSGRTVAVGTPMTVNFTLSRMGTIAGTIINGVGSPIPNVQLTFTATGVNSGAVTNTSGQYSSIGLASGTYTVTATAPGLPPRMTNGVVVSADTVTALNLTLGNRPPTAASVTPSTGTGLNATLALAYSDADGFADLNPVYTLISGALDARNACYVIYYASNALYLVSDNAQTTLGPITPGSSGSVQNSQCTLNGTGSSVATSGNNLTLNLALTFKAGFTGTKTVYMQAQDVAGASSGWVSKGTWTPGASINRAPTTVSVTPSSGTGTSQSFTLVYSDPDGFADLNPVYTLISGALDARNACYVWYSYSSLYLVSDDGQTLLGPVTPGSSGSVQNSQCTLNGTGSSAAPSGTNLTLTLALTFKAAFTGTKTIYMQAQDMAGLTSGWTNRGTWTPAASVNRAPTTVSVTPSSGTGLNASLALVYSDPDGFADMNPVYTLINGALDSRNACYVWYSYSSLYLVSDDGQILLGPVAPGSSGSVQNAQCTLNGTGSSVSTSGTNLTLTLALTFKAAFTGTKTIYMQAQDQAGLTSGWTSRGTWTPVASVNRAPTTVSVTPSSGTGLNASLSLVYSDPDGFADMNPVYTLINGVLDGRNACYVWYSYSSLYLVSDDGQTLLGPLTPGGSGSVQNAQCILNAAGSSVSTSGTNLTLNLALTFKAAFTGTKNIYMQAQDMAGLTSGWTSRGTWTPVATVNRPPTTVSVTPSSGTGSSTTFALTYSDPDGFADMSPVYVLINGALDSRNACYAVYYPASSSLYLLNDTAAGTVGPVTPGATGTVQNSQCTINASGSSASGTGTNLVLNLAVSFKPAFTGTKSVFMNAQDAAGASSGFTSRGTWIVP